MQAAQFLGPNLQYEELLRSDMKSADFLKSELPDLQLVDLRVSDMQPACSWGLTCSLKSS
jgi:hypothetical protein